MSNRNNETVRVEVTRTIAFQGPRHWVEGTLKRQITGTIQVGPGRFITDVGTEVRYREPLPDVEPDRNIQQHHEICRGLVEKERVKAHE